MEKLRIAEAIMASQILAKGRNARKRSQAPKRQARKQPAKRSTKTKQPLSLGKRIRRKFLMLLVWSIPLLLIYYMLFSGEQDLLDKYKSKNDPTAQRNKQAIEEIYTEKVSETQADADQPLLYDDEIPSPNLEHGQANPPIQADAHGQMERTNQQVNSPSTNTQQDSHGTEASERSQEPSDQNSLTVANFPDQKLYYVLIEDNKGYIAPVLYNFGNRKPEPALVLEKILEGPTLLQKDHGFSTLIPEQTYLRNLRVEDHTAIVDLTHAFQENQFGFLGSKMAVSQIVYALCEFPEINQVKILIEGEEVQYLGGPEGIVNKRFTRRDFPMEYTE